MVNLRVWYSGYYTTLPRLRDEFNSRYPLRNKTASFLEVVLFLCGVTYLNLPKPESTRRAYSAARTPQLIQTVIICRVRFLPRKLRGNFAGLVTRSHKKHRIIILAAITLCIVPSTTNWNWAGQN